MKKNSASLSYDILPSLIDTTEADQFGKFIFTARCRAEDGDEFRGLVGGKVVVGLV